ncbi:MAG: family 16 glycosylhydrolase, partial [Bacteroidota bacterium]
MYLRFHLFIIVALFSLFSLACKNEVSGPQPEVSIEGLSFEEGNTARIVNLSLTLSASAEETISIYVSSTDGSAEKGRDYIEFSRKLIEIAPGQTSAEVGITILGDESFEEDENFRVEIVEAIGATIKLASAEVTLQNDDADALLLLQGPDSPLSYPGMTLHWQDEFDGNSLDANTWTQEVREEGWFNEELQYYTDEDRNLTVRDGFLIIEARDENHSSQTGRNFNYTSARISSEDKFTFQYGRVDIRAAMPEGQGIWPALWTLGNNISSVSWPACGEIDILEMIGGPEVPGQRGETVVHNAIHWQNAGSHASDGGHYDLPSGSLHGEFHVYSLIWTDQSVTFLIDDVERDVIDITGSEKTEFHDSHFFIMNIAVGGTWPGSPDATTICWGKEVV